MKVRLISHSDLGPLVCGYAAKVCTSAEMPECPDELAVTRREGEVSPFKKALDHALNSHHDSVLEHWSATFAIEGISRACSHQLVRHRVASYCVSGGTRIRTSSQKTNGKTIRELYDYTPQYFNMLKVRCVDDDGNIKYNHPIEIVCAGIKPTYTVKTIHGYSIRTTKEHQFLTENGWKPLEDISVGERVYINGQESYKDRDWLYEMYHTQNRSQQNIADMCGVSKHCIRKWIRRFGLQKEAGSWSVGVSPPNKGRTKEDYEPLKRTSEKMMGNHNDAMYRRGPDKIGAWKGDMVSESGLRSRTARAMYPKRTGICALCGFQGVTEFHHMNKNLKEYDTNLVELCVSCHKAIHRKEVTQRIIPLEITSIEYFGEEMTYDMVMPDPYHNFIADGFVVHNSQQSQRYVNMEGFEYVTPKSMRAEDYDMAMVEYEGEEECAEYAFFDIMRKISALYKELIKNGVPEEDARYILPNACCTNIVVTMNARELRHFLGLRLCARAQWEIRELAQRMLELLKEEGPQCEQLGYCREEKGCGRFPGLIALGEEYWIGHPNGPWGRMEDE